MRKTKPLLYVAVGIWALSSVAETPYQLSLSGAFFSKYVWRGLNIVDDAVFQPAIELSAYQFTASVWGNMETRDPYPGIDNDGEFTELDYALDYSRCLWEVLNVSLGFVHYRFPNTNYRATTELYASLSYDWLLTPTLSFYHDFDEADGSYVNIALSKTYQDIWKFSDKVTLSLEGSTGLGYGSSGHNRYYCSVAEESLLDAGLTIGLPVSVGDKLAFVPTICYSTIVGKDIRKLVSKDDNFWVGVTVTYSH